MKTYLILFIISLASFQTLSSQTGTISGNIYYGDSLGFHQNLKVVLKNLSTNDSIVRSLASSSYKFTNLTLGHHYEVYLKKDKEDDSLNGVSTIDLVLIQRHILGIDKFIKPFHLIAADVSNDGLVTTFDLVLLRLLILGYTNHLDIDWKFLTYPDYLYDKVTVYNLGTQGFKQDFACIKIGDVNQNAR